MAYTIGDLGWACNVACRFEEAERWLSEADGLWRELGNMPMLTNNLNAWLLNLLWSGKYEKALGLAEEALKLSRETKNIWNEGWPRQVQGQIWLEYGEVDKALDELEASVRLAEEANTPVYVAWYRSILCVAYIQIGAVDKGMELYRLTRLANEAVPMSAGRTATLVNYALCEIAAGQLAVAASTHDACRLTETIWDYALRLAQCRLALARKDHVQAIAIADAVVESTRQLRMGQYLPDALFLKGKAHLMNGGHDRARRALEEARLAAEAIGSRRLVWQILASLAGIETDQHKAAALKTQARETVQFIADHMNRDGLRALFMQSPDVRGLMA